MAGCCRIPLLLSGAARVPPSSPPSFLLPLPCPQRARGSCSPSPTPSPMAQAPWQRPRRQGGVCQRHLSLTSSITGHHGNTHDFNTRGSPCPALPLSLHRASAEPKLEAPVPLGSEKSQFSLPTPGPRFHQTKALRSLCLQHLPRPPPPQEIPSSTPVLRCTIPRDSGRPLSPTPKPRRAWKLSSGRRHMHARERAHTARLTRTGRAVRTWTHNSRDRQGPAATGEPSSSTSLHTTSRARPFTSTHTHMALIAQL